MPHQHHDELTIEENVAEHKSAEGFLDWLQLIFHEDLGEGHLENFMHSDISDLTISAPLFTGISFVFFDFQALSKDADQEPVSSISTDIQEYRRSQLSGASYALRGPPAFA